tara:strand:+ start:1519 stop:2079 length:561 start_codon:yes stop_codon:yes gene_type:complete
MTGLVSQPEGGALFKASINSASLPGISSSSVPNGKTWRAHGVCKEIEAIAYSSGVSSTSAQDQSSTYGRFAAEGGTASGADSGTQGGADSGTGGYTHSSKWCAHYCARYCAHYCARYCARYCGIGGYGYGWGFGYGFGFGYGYGSARGYSSICTAIAVPGSGSWTQVVPSGFSVTSWLYYEELITA